MFEGVYPPIPTPFDDDGALALDRLAANLEKWNAVTPALAGYVVMGSNGEAPHLSGDEAVRLVGRTRRIALPSMKVIAGTGQLSTWATIEVTQRAIDAGADAVLVVTPFYYKGRMTGDALKRHYFAVADASSVPLVVYNVPANTGFNIPPGVVAELAAHDNIAGIKDSAGDVNQLAELVRLTAGLEFEVLSGNFGAFLPSMSFGVKGAILAVANVAAGASVAMFEAARAGRWPAAGALHLRLLPVARAVTTQYGVPGLKAALDLLDYYGGAPREPLLPLPDSARDEVGRILRDADLL